VVTRQSDRESRLRDSRTTRLRFPHRPCTSRNASTTSPTRVSWRSRTRRLKRFWTKSKQQLTSPAAEMTSWQGPALWLVPINLVRRVATPTSGTHRLAWTTLSVRSFAAGRPLRQGIATGEASQV